MEQGIPFLLLTESHFKWITQKFR